MSDNYTDETFGNDEQDQQEVTPKALREAANRSAKHKQEADTLRRENAFLKAGINADDARLAYFVKGYDGELSAEAIRKAAYDAGFIQPPQQGQQAQGQQIAAAEQRIMQAGAGAMGEGVTEAGAIARLEAAMSEGGVPAMLEVARQFGIPVV